MKCNYCGTTIPEGSKKCNGCGKKVNFLSSIRDTQKINNNYRNIESYYKTNKTKETKIEQQKNLFQQSKEPINNIYIQDKNASLATILSIIGIMFIPFGFVFNIIALNKAKQIEDSIQKEKTLRVVKILLTISLMMILFTLLPIIFIA